MGGQGGEKEKEGGGGGGMDKLYSYLLQTVNPHHTSPKNQYQGWIFSHKLYSIYLLSLDFIRPPYLLISSRLLHVL